MSTIGMEANGNQMTIKNIITLFCLHGLLFSTAVMAKQNPQEDYLTSFARHRDLRRDSLFKNLKWKNIGPTFCGGRVVDIEGYEKYSGKFWVAAATGGLWLTRDQGLTWQTAFENEATASIGDIAVVQNNENLIWVGSGESNSQEQSYSGCGVYKSSDSGRTWKHMGLGETRHIARVLIDPLQPETVYVAAIGPLNQAHRERGIYKTIDNGKTWSKILFISEKTGIIDLVMDPNNRNTLYAAAWQKERKPWNFVESGLESAIYKTVDGGSSWEKCGGGFPQNRAIGRIGLAVSRSNPRVLYALVDNQEAKISGQTPGGLTRSGLSVASIAAMGNDQFLALNDEQLGLFLIENLAPKVYSPLILKGFVSSGRFSPQLIAQMLFDANDRRVNPNTIGAEVYRSNDQGQHWTKVNCDYIEDMYITYGFYFGQIRVAPDNENTVYILGVSAYRSDDGGRTFKKIGSETGNYAEALVHRDHHALWIDPKNPRCLILGNDGGINLSYDGGNSWSKVTSLSISQCYTVTVDDERPANIFIGTQDNGVLTASYDLGINAGQPAWRMLLGGDGAFVAPLPGNAKILFAAAQFGALVRFDAEKSKPIPIKPKSPQLFEPYRFNWLSPLLASRQYPGTLYFAANKVLQSKDNGYSWQDISLDLSKLKNIDGNTPYATITAIAESELNPDILYAGTDDGNVWLRAGRESRWQKISQALPQKRVNRVLASKYQAEKVYLIMNGSKEDDNLSYIFVSENSGQDWESLRANLPAEPLNVLLEDPQQKNILYLGSDRGVYISLDEGGSWISLQGNLPTVPVTDMAIQRRDKTMIIATYGRGVYILPLAEIKQRLPAPRN
jgi:photosystem II stability/assembly factor-like uncharacterized protein